MVAFDPERITFFAKTDARGQEVAFGIRAKDRQRHMYVVGKTGMGKSTLLENMAAQDIQNGEGMAFIDPHGSAAEKLLEYVPEHRVKDVVYFAPFDLERPISFNVMEDVGPDKRHLVVAGLMSTFKKIWVDAWSARMEYILTNALLVLIEYPDSTLLSVNRLFSDKVYRNKVVDYCKDPAVKSFWTEEFANYTDRFTADALPAIQNKIGQFTGNPLIRNIIGQPHSSFDIRKLMDEKKILIMNLSKGLIGDTNANLLGSMLTTRIYLAAMSRADLPVAQMSLMPNFYFYVDEFQSFANATFANILSEARKYHLNLIIAHQYIEQMEEDVRHAVFGNVGTTIAFRVGPFDAETLETVFSPRFLATDLVNLGFAQIYLTLMIDGIGSQPFSAKTLPSLELPSVSCRDMVISESRKNYAQNREEVEKIISDLHTPQKADQPKKQFDKRQNSNQYSQSNSSPKTYEPLQSPQTAQANRQQQSVQSTNPTQPARPNQSNQVAAPIRQEDSFSSKKPEYINERRNNYVEKRQPLAQKTPEDLRQILSKMTQGNSSEKKNNSISVTTDTKDEASKPKQKSFDKKSLEKSPLKNALADVLKQAGVVNPSSLSTPTKTQAEEESQTQPRVHEHPKQNQQSQGPLEAAQKPQNNLSVQTPAYTDVITQQPRSVEHVATQPKEEERQNFKGKMFTSVPRSIQNHSAPRSQIRKVVVEHRQRRQAENPLLNRNAVESHSRDNNNSPEKVEDEGGSSIDAAEVKRMLRQSDSERSPFN